MHFSSLGLLGLHFANPQSALQQLSWWPAGTPGCAGEGLPVNLTPKQSVQLCPLKGWLSENLQCHKEIAGLHLKTRTIKSQWISLFRHYSPYQNILPTTSLGLASMKGSVEIISYHDSLIQRLFQFERKLGTSVKIKDVNTFMPVRPSDENKWRAQETMKISVFKDTCVRTTSQRGYIF